MISSRKVCENYANMMLGLVEEKKVLNKTALNMHISTKNLWSFMTPIASYHRGYFYVTSINYSSTTRKHQTYAEEEIRKVLAKNGLSLKKLRFTEKRIADLDYQFYCKKIERSEKRNASKKH